MFNKKLALSLSGGFGIPDEEQILLFKKTGFEGFAIDDSGRKADIAKLTSIGKKEKQLIET